MKWLLRIVVAAIAAFVLWQVWQRVFVTDETRVRREISAMVSATEKGDVLRLSDALAGDYSDDWGMDKSMLIGAVHGYRGLVRELIAELKRELKVRHLPVVATGGYAGLIAARLPEISVVEPNLTLEGLRLVWRSLPVKH